MQQDVFDSVFDNTNWNDIADAPPAVPSGEYHVKITKCERVKSKEKQTPGILVEIVVQAGEYAGRTITQRIWVTDKTKWAVKAFFGKRGLDLIGADGKIVESQAEGWEGIVKLTTKIEDGKDFPDYRFKPVAVLK